MKKRTTYLAWIAGLGLSALAAPGAQAKFVAIFEEVGSNVEEIGDGTINLTDLGAPGQPVSIRPSVSPDVGTLVLGAPGRNVTFFTGGGITGPGSFGPGAGARADVGAGDGIVATSSSIAVPLNYPSGARLSAISYYRDQSYDSLGMTPGVYIWTWGSGFSADSLVLDIVAPTPGNVPDNSVLSTLPFATTEVFSATAPVPEPSTWAMLLVGFAGLGYAAVRRNGRVRAVSA
jgi:hypothetical protein